MSESEDFLQYERLVEEALRGVMRKALDLVAREGLVGEHYFHITFRTDHPGVDIPASLRREFPLEMPIILQNAFWDLEVGEIGFSVSLSFNRVQQRLTVPFDAITIFQDPPASFRLQFQADDDDSDSDSEMPDGGAADTPLALEKSPREDILAALQAGDNENSGDDEEKSGKVVTLDRFRNK
ncbi:MAG: hypothetical protein KAR37_06895 [Alphaproteobacteria bacterium]|jgi:hypothetical protein|nr:hypothetical protein [Alphaproteobacteria bacterium]